MGDRKFGHRENFTQDWSADCTWEKKKKQPVLFILDVRRRQITGFVSFRRPLILLCLLQPCNSFLVRKIQNRVQKTIRWKRFFLHIFFFLCFETSCFKFTWQLDESYCFNRIIRNPNGLIQCDATASKHHSVPSTHLKRNKEGHSCLTGRHQPAWASAKRSALRVTPDLRRGDFNQSCPSFPFLCKWLTQTKISGEQNVLQWPQSKNRLLWTSCFIICTPAASQQPR